MRGVTNGRAGVRVLLPAFVGVLLVPACFAPMVARAGVVEDAVAATEDGRIRFEYPTREGVVGDGRSLRFRETQWSDWRCDCSEGPARVQLRVRDGRVIDVDVRVGGRWRAARASTVDLGALSPARAADALLTLAERATDGDLEEAILGAVIAEDFDDHARLVRIARDGDRPRDLRESAVFWLGQAAGARATTELVRLVEDDDEDLQLREHAIFALSQRGIEECFGPLRRVATSSPHPQLREKAFFWLAQHDDARVVAFFEDVLVGGE